MAMSELKNRASGLYSDERLRELSGGGWLFRFMEQFPAIKEVQRGVEEACLQGAIDMHVHADPCSLVPRNQDFTQVAIDAARAGMRAVVRKDHFHSTVGEAYAVQRHVDHLVETGALAQRIEVFGGIPLQSLDAALLERALRHPQFKMIWCNPVGGEALVSGGKVRPEMERVLQLAAEHGKAFNLGQPSHSAARNAGLSDYDGLAPLCERIREIGARAVLDHPLSSFNADQIEALSGGTVLAGLFCYPTLPSVIKAPVVDPARTLELVRRLGPQRCLIASDVGMLLEPTALEAYRLMIRLLVVLGCSTADVSVMIKDNPARLLGLNGGGQERS
jgi:Family of unknown function (DUF6282)